MHVHTSTCVYLIKQVYICLCVCICKYENVSVSLFRNNNFQLRVTINV